MDRTISGLEYHLRQMPWTHFGTLTLRVVPPQHILNKCIFEYLRRITKRFCNGKDLNWATSWIVRFEYGERNGRLHCHFLFISDKPATNKITQCKTMEHMWEVETASRWVNRLNQDQKKHNQKLRGKYHYLSDAQFMARHGDRLRPEVRNDFSAPGFADVRVYDRCLDGASYIMKGEDFQLNGANRYELAKFNNITRDGVTLMASNLLLMKLFLNSGIRAGTGDRARFVKSLEERNNTSRIDPQGSETYAPNRSKQLFDPQPEFTSEPWSLADSDY